MAEKGFREMLAERQKKVNSLVCVGLDPLIEKMPACLGTESSSEAGKLQTWMREIVMATAPYVCMFKPQRAHWEAIDQGERMLRDLVYFIKTQHPDIPVFLDCKRGDIGRTQKQYAKAHLILDDVHGMNFSPYMGDDCLKSLVLQEKSGAAIVGLGYTSNPAAREIQDLKLADGRCLWEWVVEAILRWAEAAGVVKDAGVVMAAAYENPKGSGKVYSWHLTRGREIVGDKLWFLIPGIGRQGGFVKETVKTAFKGPGTIVMNSSSDIIEASSSEDFAEAAAKKTEELCDQIREAGGNCSGPVWAKSV
jgi:orotidine-5'-phosphate decarboxylase